MRLIFALFFASALTQSAVATLGNVYDLNDDWSDLSNPNGVWSLRKNPTDLFSVVQQDYLADGANQRAWADDPYPITAHVPVWMKITSESDNAWSSWGSHDIRNGDLMMHGSVWNRTASDITSATFTSPIAGTARIDGWLFYPYQRGRNMTWQILSNGIVVTSGALSGNGTYTREHPFSLADGSGGLTALTQDVGIGDELQLRFTSVDNLPDLLTMRYHIEVTPLPEPAGLAVLCFGTLGLIRRWRREGDSNP